MAKDGTKPNNESENSPMTLRQAMPVIMYIIQAFIAIITLLLGFVVNRTLDNLDTITNAQTEIRKELSDLESRVHAREANQFTAQDGLDLWKEIGKVRQEMAIIAPPDWLISRMESMEKAITANSLKIDQVKDLVIKATRE